MKSLPIYLQTMRIFNVLLTAFFTLFFTSACTSNMVEDLYSKQNVTIKSIPSGSHVYIDGELIGETPIALSLRSDMSHEIHFQKEGFKSSKEYLNPVYKYDKIPYVQFGLAKDLGYYYKLSSDYIISELDWESLPNSVGVNSFEAMSELIAEADSAKSSGSISDEEHSIIMRQIVELFN